MVNMVSYLEKKNKMYCFFLSLTLITLITIINIIIGSEIEISIFYLAPIALVTWTINARTGYLFSFFCTGILITNVLMLSQENNIYQLVNYWNLAVNIGFFVPLVYVISKLKEIILEREKTIQTKLDEALAKIKILKEFLPICASCKKIRDETGQWVQIEYYISLHTNTTFSHGICPECAQKLYPDIFPKIKT